MKSLKALRLNILILMLAYCAGIIFFCCAFSWKLPKGISINGIEVGGKTQAEAVKLVRESIVSDLKEKSLAVHGKSADYIFSYPEIGYKDNLQALIKSVKKGGEYTATVSYYLNGIGEVVSIICADESQPAVEPYAIFNAEGEPFTYFEGNDGIRADKLKLLNDIQTSLQGNFEEVFVSTKVIYRTVAMSTVRYNTRLLSTFTTQFDGTNTDRAYNIFLASDKINGSVLENGEGFSFNNTVGARTAERGFRPAKIIEKGEYVEGIGGGVCQVSTTLFNAALLAGCDMTEFHQHSLAVSYVPPSFDAMVSGSYFDLKFENRTGYPLYIRSRTDENSVTFDIYGRGDGAQYGYQSVVTGNIAPPEEFTSDISAVKEGKSGTISEGYLTVNRNGVSTTKLLRRDKYAPTKRVVLEEPQPEEQEETPTVPSGF